MKTTNAKFSPKTIRIFEETDGFHYCPANSEFLDARGRGYPTKKTALGAAREAHEMKSALAKLVADCDRLADELAESGKHPMTGATVFELNESNARLTVENDTLKSFRVQLLAALEIAASVLDNYGLKDTTAKLQIRAALAAASEGQN